MEKKNTSHIKIVIIVLLVLAIALAGIAILQIHKKNKYVTFSGDLYELRLHNDGHFSICWLASSFIGISDSEAAYDLYRWDGDTLILEFGDSVGVLYFQKEGDTLVFQREQSVFPEDPRYGIGKLPDGTILKKIEQ